MYRRLLASLVPVLALGCVQPWPTIEPLPLAPITPGDDEWRVIDHVVLITDASGTMGIEALFPEARAITRSLVAAMPPLGIRARGAPEYKASLIAFGGNERVTVPHDRFDRVPLLVKAELLRPLGGPPMGGSTPLAKVIAEAAASLSDERGPAALVLIGDGRADGDDTAVAAMRSLVSGHPDPVCIHAVHTGESAKGRALLERLAALSSDGCGSMRSADSVRHVGAVESFEREIFLAGIPEPSPQVAAAPPPGSSACDQRTVLRGVTFELDRAVLRPESLPVLAAAARQLLACAGRRMRIEGHTCSLGSDGYNAELSRRRAASVRDYLVGHGVSPGRLQALGLGESNPVAPNTTEEGRGQNRRVELVPLD